MGACTMRKILTPLLFLIVLPSFALTQNKPANSLKYLWPTDASKYLTSAFGEYRARRFHTGIDVKTWGKTGYKIFAVRPGYILRVSVSPAGYGKSVYLKLDTGETAVYAHLSKFNAKLQVPCRQSTTSRRGRRVSQSPMPCPVRGGVLRWPQPAC